MIVLVSIPLAFLTGILRAQLARAGMADLVVRLQQAPDAERLGELLSGALHDPSLELVYWLPGFECYVDASGRPLTLPTDDPRRAVTPIDHDGDHVAALVHDAALAYEPDSSRSFARPPTWRSSASGCRERDRHRRPQRARAPPECDRQRRR